MPHSELYAKLLAESRRYPFVVSKTIQVANRSWRNGQWSRYSVHAINKDVHNA